MASSDDYPLKRIHSVSIRLDDETRERLRVIARRDNRTMSNLVFLIVRDWLSQHEEPEEAAQGSRKKGHSSRMAR
jgi:predicted transcriptional regulator